jgi:hypothetical protein
MALSRPTKRNSPRQTLAWVAGVLAFGCRSKR